MSCFASTVAVRLLLGCVSELWWFHSQLIYLCSLRPQSGAGRQIVISLFHIRLSLSSPLSSVSASPASSLLLLYIFFSSLFPDESPLPSVEKINIHRTVDK